MSGTEQPSTQRTGQQAPCHEATSRSSPLLSFHLPLLSSRISYPPHLSSPVLFPLLYLPLLSLSAQIYNFPLLSSLRGPTETRPPKLTTIITLSNCAPGLPLLPPLRVAISAVVPRLRHLALREGEERSGWTERGMRAMEGWN